MSGIAGILNLDGQPVDPQLLTRMTDAMAHRGPDGAGHWLDGAVGLGHRLLHTTPESLHETQPFVSPDGHLVIVCDGRIDNRDELKAASGSTLRTDTDVELILNAYDRWGVECPAHLIGDFAVAIWDRRHRRLFCARDPLGVKPLYYRWDGRRFLFASEINAILEDPAVPRRPDAATIADYLVGKFRDAEATFFESIHQAPPAHALILENGQVRLHRYWEVDPAFQLRLDGVHEYQEAYCARFREAVRCRLAGCAPAAVLLSGGIDSTSVTAMAESLRKEAPELAAPIPLVLMCEGFLKEDWNAIERLTAAYGTAIQTVRPQPQNGAPTFYEFFLDCAETPHYDTFLTIPVLLQPAATQSSRGILTGLGADELSLSAEWGFLEDLLYRGRWGQFAQQMAQHQQAYGSDPHAIWRNAIWMLWNRCPPRLRWLAKRLLGRVPEPWMVAAPVNRLNRAIANGSRGRVKFPTRCQQASYDALTSPTMSFGLNQMDGLTSRFSMECRHPYLDRRLIEFFLAIPPSVKLHFGHRKQFVQHALEPVLPGPIRRVEREDEAIPWMGPRDPAYRLRETQRIRHVLSVPDAMIYRYLDRAVTQRLIERFAQGRLPLGYRNVLWNFVRLQLWLTQWFVGR